MASPKMEGQFSTSNNHEGSSIDNCQASDVQPAGPSRRSNTRRRGLGVLSQEERRKRKRENDRAFRQRQKERVNEMKGNLLFLSEENTNLKRENQVLMTEKDSMAQNLTSAAMETQQLQSEITRLNRSIVDGQQFVDLYLNQLVATGTSQRVFELRQLEIENYILGRTDWENWDSEKQLLLQNMAQLEVENKSLKLQHEALGEFIDANEDGQQG